MEKSTTIFFVMMTVIITGAISTIITKILYISESLGVTFTHAWFITFLMFIGELSCFIFYHFIKKETKHKKPEIYHLKLSIPPLLDLCASTFANISLIFLPGSIYQMLKGSIIIFALLLSIFVLKNKHNISHYSGAFLVIIGFILVGFSSYISNLNSNEKNKTDFKIIFLGIILILISQMVQACQVIYEENIMKNYYIHPFQFAGYEGFYGCIFSIIIMLILQCIKCKPNTIFCEGFCISDDKGIYRMSNFIFAIKQIFNNCKIFYLIIGYIAAIAFYNSSGIALAGYTSGTARSLVDTIRTVFIWLFFMLNITKNDKIKESFSFIQFSGFIFLIMGNLIYNEIFVMHNKKFDLKNQKNNGNKKNEETNYLIRSSS